MKLREILQSSYGETNIEVRFKFPYWKVCEALRGGARQCSKPLAVIYKDDWENDQDELERLLKPFMDTKIETISTEDDTADTIIVTLNQTVFGTSC